MYDEVQEQQQAGSDNASPAGTERATIPRAKRPARRPSKTLPQMTTAELQALIRSMVKRDVAEIRESVEQTGVAYLADEAGEIYAVAVSPAAYDRMVK